MEDQQFAERIRRTRARAHNLELDGFPARMRDIAVELLQTSLVSLERGLQREEFEGVEADEHLDNYNASHQALAQAVGRVMRELRVADAPSAEDADRVNRFIEDNPVEGLRHETMDRLEEIIEETRSLARKIFAEPEVALERLDGAIADLRTAHEDFQREHSELLDAQDELAEIRNEVYVNILNARDIMRAALRTIDRLEELDAVIPPLADLIGVQS